MERFDFIVIGGGMMGAPCARYLAEAGHSVALVAAPEPAPGGAGPFASHHDAARIARALASDPDWARLGARSMARYADIEARSGERIFRRSGGVLAGLRAGPLAGFTKRFLAVASGMDPAPAVAEGDAGGWTLPEGSVAACEPGGGWIDPRAMARAQVRLAEAAGAQVFPQAAIARAGRDVTLADGTRLSAGHVIVASGPHAASDGFLPRRPAMTVWARTVAFVEVDETEAERLADLSTLIWVPGETWTHDLYALPPVRYPDGRWRLKVGGQGASGPRIEDAADMAAWFHGPGDPEVGAALLAELRRALPGLREAATSTGPCAVVWTETGFPYVDAAGPGVTVLAGGNGAAAKCGDELGRLGMLRATGAELAGEGYRATFEARWA
ncbi:FAD-binding oxidoreductase [Jannaschia sp. W003]|uniref:NAD(P)/FAD-dependent oxidoreductase n=1 Tax=Jannaschia sp. W003 TaxID=2867012 RepID=UPI0021A5434E|nr:FAD-dependent oxidoreductase [Jannaschia sp. W003]UWQ21367.1 FAD-binding oxidoreductase [Jannaschia sp. W003]